MRKRNSKKELIRELKEFKVFFLFILLFLIVNYFLMQSIYSQGIYCNNNDTINDCPAGQLAVYNKYELRPFNYLTSAYIHSGEEHLKHNSQALLYETIIISFLFFFYSHIRKKANKQQAIKGIYLISSIFVLSIFIIKPIANLSSNSPLSSFGFSGVLFGIIGVIFSIFLLILIKYLDGMEVIARNKGIFAMIMSIITLIVYIFFNKEKNPTHLLCLATGTYVGIILLTSNNQRR